MYLTHKICVSWMISIVAVSAIGAGCQRMEQPRADRLNQTPIMVDDAMEKRQWDQSNSIYASGDVLAGSARTTLEPTRDDGVNTIVDPAIGVANLVLIPFTFISDSPGEEIAHPGATVPPTYTAVPEIRTIP